MVTSISKVFTVFETLKKVSKLYVRPRVLPLIIMFPAQVSTRWLACGNSGSAHIFRVCFLYKYNEYSFNIQKFYITLCVCNALSLTTSRDLFVFRTEMYFCSPSNGVTLPPYKEIIRMRKCQYYGIKSVFFNVGNQLAHC